MPKTITEFILKNSINSTLSVRPIGRKYNIPESTLRQWLKVYKKTGQMCKRKSPGRPRKLFGKISTFIVKFAYSNKTASAKQIALKIKEMYGINVCNNTVISSLKRMGYVKKKAICKPILSENHKLIKKNGAFQIKKEIGRM